MDDDQLNKWNEPLPEKLDKSSKFELVQFLGGHYWLARDTTNRRQYIAKKLVDFDDYHKARHEQHRAHAWHQYMPKAQRYAKGLEELTYEHGLSRHVSFVMNHDNLISFAGFIRHKPHNPEPFDDTQATDDYLLWDFCDAGSLELLLVNKGQKPPLIGKSFLPESLCWHVLTSVMRALTWLHDGYRRNVNFDSKKPRDYVWACHDIDWVPILHRNIAGTTILFQHPEGNETYGQCKLGDMRQVAVCGQPADRFEDPVDEEGILYNAIGSVISAPKPRKAVEPAEATNKDREHPSIRDMRRGIKAWMDGGKVRSQHARRRGPG
jgi:serine/threonine protein kinase